MGGYSRLTKPMCKPVIPEAVGPSTPLSEKPTYQDLVL